MAPPPKATRPRFHVFLYPEDLAEDQVDTTEPDYLATVTITNRDQLLAENQAKGLGIKVGEEGNGFHVSNLWIWAACVRRELTRDKFKVFSNRLEYAPVEKGKGEGEETEDPTSTGQDHNTG